jgi:hypothetical protein
MIRNLKAFGLALVAVFAVNAAVATAAQATAGTLTTFPAGKSVLATGEQVGEHVFTLTDHPAAVGSQTVKCKKAAFTGTASVATGATSVQIHPVYTECTAFDSPATITTTGCDYVFKTGTPTADGLGWHVTTDIGCSGANVIKIVTGVCEVTIGSQSGLTTSHVTNSGPASPETAMDLLLHMDIGGIKYTVVKDAIGCTLSGTGSFSKGDYKGTSTLKAHDSTTGAAVGITIH